MRGSSTDSHTDSTVNIFRVPLGGLRQKSDVAPTLHSRNKEPESQVKEFEHPRGKGHHYSNIPMNHLTLPFAL